MKPMNINKYLDWIVISFTAPHKPDQGVAILYTIEPPIKYFTRSYQPHICSPSVHKCNRFEGQYR